MFLKELKIKDFKSFYGEHNFSFNKGINVITGGCGVGKTNLCKAIEFALFGAIGFASQEYNRIINMKRIEEADRKCDWIGCEVDLLFEDNYGEYRINRTFSPFMENEVNERLTYSTLSPKINSLEYYEYVYIEDLSNYLEINSAKSLGYSMIECLSNIINQNICNDIGLLLLDAALARFSSDYREKALNLLEESALDQIILLKIVSQEIPASLISKIICLGETIESVTFKVQDFPFPSEELLDEIDIMINNRYVSKGEAFKRDVYGHEYTIEAVKVIPNGARYQRSTSKIKVI